MLTLLLLDSQLDASTATGLMENGGWIDPDQVPQLNGAEDDRRQPRTILPASEFWSFHQ
jgi:hypothetical protein